MHPPYFPFLWEYEGFFVWLFFYPVILVLFYEMVTLIP